MRLSEKKKIVSFGIVILLLKKSRLSAAAFIGIRRGREIWMTTQKNMMLYFNLKTGSKHKHFKQFSWLHFCFNSGWCGGVLIAEFSLLSNLSYLPNFFFHRTSEIWYLFSFYGQEKLDKPLLDLFYYLNFRLLSLSNLVLGGHQGHSPVISEGCNI